MNNISATVTGSYVFLLHLLGFGLITGVTFVGWILNRRFSTETDTTLKLYLGGVMRTVGVFSSAAALLMLLTGIGNIYNMYAGDAVAWYRESWLVVKVVLFGIMLTNGMLLGPSIARKRLRLLQSRLDEPESAPSDEAMKHLNGQMQWFHLVQTVLIIGIVCFSVFGPLRHPGIL
jgi:hypothetical protein